MSDAHNEHESAIRTPKQLFAAVAGFFLVTVIGIILLVVFVTTPKLPGAGTDSQNATAVSERLRPVADIGFTLKDINAPKVFLAGDAVFNASCINCHGSAASGAPVAGDAAAWAPRIAQGYDTLVKHALEGLNGMPKKGGNPDLDDLEVARAVVYMANKSGAKFEEPKVPALVVATPAPVAAAPVEPVAPVVEAAPAVETPAAPAAAPVVAAVDGKKLYTTSCAMCHAGIMPGAPAFADKAAWAPRIKQGAPVLYEHAIKGFTGKAGMMPAKGGSTASDEEVKAAVDYMVSAAK